MISKTPAYVTNGKAYTTLAEAQIAELNKLLAPILGLDTELIAKQILESKVAILDILTTTPRSRPARRKIHQPAALKPPPAKPVTIPMALA